MYIVTMVQEDYNKALKRAYEDGVKKGKVFNKDEQNLNYRMGFNDGWHDCEASFELGNEFTDSIQEQAYDEGFVEGYNQHEYETYQNLSEKEKVLKAEAWDEGYDQAIDDLIEAGVIGEEEYLDEDFEGYYSEYEFGDVEDDEEEYCFSKELDKILNSEKAQYKVDPSVPSMGNRYDENGKLCGFFINTGNKKIGGITTNTKEDLVNNPSHYNSDPSGVKCIEITRHRNNNIGNVIKYVWRNGLKDGNSNIQDLEKAAWYLNDEVQRLKGIE